VSAPARSCLIALPGGGQTLVRVNVNRRARAIALKIDPTCRAAVLVAPSERRVRDAVRFAQDRSAWIASRLAALPPPAPFRPDGFIPFGDSFIRLERAEGRVGPVLEPGRLVVAATPDRFAAAVRRALVARAKAAFAARLARHAEALGLPAPPLSVKDMRSRWGSCARDGRIAMSWRLIAAPAFVIDYVCAHEAAHLKEMNHGPRFWAIVHRLVGPHQAARAWLKAHGPALHALGAEA
jgi:predicted metal-dependent hydrolase